jgi:hypothetical protein
MGGKADEIKGRVKEAAGAITDNDKLRRELTAITNEGFRAPNKTQLLCLERIAAICGRGSPLAGRQVHSAIEVHPI